jgi:hypothetical protein
MLWEEIMENEQVTPVSQYASFLTPEASNMLTTEAEPLVELPTDEINVAKAKEIDQALAESATSMAVELDNAATMLLTHVDGTSEEVKVFKYPQDGSRQELQGKTLLQQSISTLKELTDNSEVQKALESEGLTVDYAKINQFWNDGTGFASVAATIRPLNEEEEAAVEGGTCACTDCIESTDSDVDTDTMLIVHDLSERLAALEARIALYNTKASHKI